MPNQTKISSWNDRYATSEYMFGTEPNDFLVEISSQLEPGTTLCLADGEGRNGVYLASLGHQVTSVDLSANALSKADKLAKKNGVSLALIETDLMQYDLGERQWDNIISIFFHLPTQLRVPMHQKISRALKPGGILTLEAYTPKQLEYKTGGPPLADNLMTSSTLTEDFPELDFIHLVEKEREVNEGTLHHGHAAVVQLLARKPL